jgi:hypothetical protein
MGYTADTFYSSHAAAAIEKFGAVSAKHVSLTKFCKTRWAEYKELDSILSLCDVSGLVGCLPPSFSKYISYQDIKKLDDVFAGCVSELSKYYLIPTEKEWKCVQKQRKILEKNLKKLFKKAKIYISKHISSGVFGRVLKVCIDEQSYALKIFYDDGDGACHGTIPEIRNALACQKMASKLTKKFYFGNLSRGYMFSEWLNYESFYQSNNYRCSSKDREFCKIQNPNDTDFLILHWDACQYNCTGKKLIDFGGIEKNHHAVLDYRQRKTSRSM